LFAGPTGTTLPDVNLILFAAVVDAAKAEVISALRFSRANAPSPYPNSE